MTDSSIVVGTWRAVSWHRRFIATGAMDGMALGTDPVGFINYGTDGRMIVILARRDRPPPGTDDPTDAEKLRLFDTMAAYAGSYTVHDDRLVHHIDIAWNQSWAGSDQVRYFRLDGDLLTLTSAPTRDPVTGEEIELVATWRKHRSDT
jgi:hypothetical protein